MQKNTSRIKLGNRIKEYRKRHDLFRIDLAKILGVSLSAIINWEYNKNLPSQQHAEAMAAHFGVEIKDLFYIP